jgi:hypothetical protein
MTTQSLLLTAVAGALFAGSAGGQGSSARPPVIDIHIHTTPDNAAGWARVDSQLNVRYRLITVASAHLDRWAAIDSSRFIPALGFPCDRGHAVITGGRCFADGGDFPDTTWLRGEIRAGRIRAFAELVPQYSGMSPADPRLDPFYSIAEEFDLPVGIHMGPGPPGAAYPSVRTPYKSPEYRAALSNPMLLEEVLMRHKKLRLFVMHAGWPMLESTIALLYAHPGVHVDVGILQRDELVPRAAYYRYLRGLVEAGFAKRIMFGSDSPAANQRVGIQAILDADFLTTDQKSDILCGNAMRFLRLAEGVCR